VSFLALTTAFFGLAWLASRVVSLYVIDEAAEAVECATDVFKYFSVFFLVLLVISAVVG